MSGLEAQAEGFAEQLDRIAEQLDDLAFDELREAAADGATQRPRTDKRLMQARRAIDRAASLLRSIDQTL